MAQAHVSAGLGDACRFAKNPGIVGDASTVWFQGCSIFAYVFQGEGRRASLSPSTEVITRSAKTLQKAVESPTETPQGSSGNGGFPRRELGCCWNPRSRQGHRHFGWIDTADPFDYLLASPASGGSRTLSSCLTPVDVAVSRRRLIMQNDSTSVGASSIPALPVLRVTFVQQHLVAAFESRGRHRRLDTAGAGVLQAC